MVFSVYALSACKFLEKKNLEIATALLFYSSIFSFPPYLIAPSGLLTL